MKLRLAIELIVFNVTMYIVAVSGNFFTIALFVCGKFIGLPAYDWIPWVASAALAAVTLLHYFVHRTAYYLSTIDEQSRKYEEALSNKINNSGIVFLLNLIILLPLISVVISCLLMGYGSEWRVILRIGGVFCFIFVLGEFIKSRGYGRSGWVNKSD